MNEEQQVLAFFAAKENLPLALIAAEHLDEIRRNLNNEFWQVMNTGLEALLAAHSLPWTTKLTEDRNSDGCLVGLYLEPRGGGRTFLRPFMEQQYIGEGYRIYYGLMWSNPPDAGEKAPAAVTELAADMEKAGFKQGDNFFGWQWLPWHPRRRDFLMKFGVKREEFLAEMMRPWEQLLLGLGEQLQHANRVLGEAGTTVSVSLDQLRGSLPSRNG
ncbi:MAG TPA: hypothetical protein VKC56_06040 [Gallionellaceae bacterium]|nr:hypothetical protein [Gallionellaceae bacterium]